MKSAILFWLAKPMAGFLMTVVALVGVAGLVLAFAAFRDVAISSTRGRGRNGSAK